MCLISQSWHHTRYRWTPVYCKKLIVHVSFLILVLLCKIGCTRAQFPHKSFCANIFLFHLSKLTIDICGTVPNFLWHVLHWYFVLKRMKIATFHIVQTKFWQVSSLTRVPLYLVSFDTCQYRHVSYWKIWFETCPDWPVSCCKTFHVMRVLFFNHFCDMCPDIHLQ